jgi:hypothetical protein
MVAMLFSSESASAPRWSSRSRVFNSEVGQEFGALTAKG